MEYRVRWEIDLDAETPRQAAEMALDLLRDVNEDGALNFEVWAIPESWPWDKNREMVDLGRPEEQAQR